MTKMPRLRTKLMHLTLPTLCVLCVVIVKVKPIAVYKGCPVDCDCLPDDIVHETWALKATCRDAIKEVPQLSPNITTLELKITSFNSGFAFSSGPSLRRLQMSSSSPKKIHADAFQSLKKLSHLFLLDIGFSRVPSELFCELLHIEHLSLIGNHISKISFAPCLLKAQTKMSSLELSDNPLKTVQADNFINLQNHNVTELILSMCELTDLQPGLFQYLPHLSLLDISSNYIEFLPPGIFSNLSNLRDLIIDGNDLISLSFEKSYSFIPVLQRFESSASTSSGSNVSFPRAFMNATSLSRLYIELMDTQNLNKDIFANLIRSPVTEMTLEMRSVIWISSAAFDPLHFLQTLDIRLGGNLEPEALYNMSISLGRLPVKKLTIFHSAFNVLNTQTLFEGFRPNNNLRHLKIILQGGIKKIRRNTFQYLNKVEHLRISSYFSKSDGLAAGAFSGLKSLRKLDLRLRELTSLRRNNFQDLSKVEHLIISRSSLESVRLEAGSFRGLNSLRKLDLSSNKLTYFPRRTRLEISATVSMLDLKENFITDIRFVHAREWSNLTFLNLESNKMFTVYPLGGWFRNFYNLEYLNLHSNEITLCNFTGMPFLKEVILSKNIVQFISFQNSNVLEHLDLRNNPFTELSTDYPFLHLPSLKLLTLDESGITVLQDEMFNNNQMLKKLGLNHNFIVSWRPEVFRPLRQLTHLTMANNKIVDAPEPAFKYLTSLAYLDLSGNPLACTCNLLWFKNWISTPNVYLVSYNIKDKYTCAFPEQEKNTPLIDFQLTIEDCTSHLLFSVVMGSIVGFLLVCTALSLAYRFRWYIRYYIFLVRSRRRQMYDALVENETFKYDVYVCYHNTSRHWVINELLPKLEHEAGIQLCLHDRNWLAGPTIIDNIIESIEQSRKTLLLVNNGFAQSGWCREETSLAYHRLIETQRNMLIVVLLEDVQQENMDKLLRSILTKRVYLKYSQSKTREPRFWKALKAALRKGEHPAAGVELHRA